MHRFIALATLPILGLSTIASAWPNAGFQLYDGSVILAGQPAA
jgi:hypothetical protein